MQDSDFIGNIESYMYEDHVMLRRASIQCWANLCLSPDQVKRCEGANDRIKYCVLLCGDAEDQEVVKAAGGALAMLTSQSSKVCQKVYDSSQWEECMLNLLASKDVEICMRGVVVVGNIVKAGKEAAEPIMNSQAMDVLQALVMKAKLDEGSCEPDQNLQKIRVICEETLKEAHLLGVIKTYQEGVQEEEEDDKLEDWAHHPKAKAITN